MKTFKQCSSCHSVKLISEFGRLKKSADKKQYACDKCRAVKASRWYENNKERHDTIVQNWRAKNPKRREAHILVSKAVSKGDIEVPNCCSQCGKVGQVDLHHADYNKPYEVEPVCRKCHKQIHNAINDFVEAIS